MEQMFDRQQTGRAGEDRACSYLESVGHRILERNWRGGHLEIDIITLAGDGVHFVEVKTRTAPVQAAPEENVGPVKQRKITAAALRYLNTRGRDLGDDVEAFFDVVSVVFDGDKATIDYFPSAWVPMYV